MLRPFIWMLAILMTTTAANAADKIRIACVGDSVTFGDGLKQREQAYPGQLQKLLGDSYEVKNFGVNSMAVLKKADFSYFNDKAYKAALAFNPNIVVLQFGGNDSKSQNWPAHKDDFLHDYKELIDSFRNLPTKPRIVINTTSPAFVNKWNIEDKIILGEVIPQIRQTAFNENLEIIDIHTALVGKGDMFPDKMHPGPEACTYMAKVVEGVLMFKDDPAYNFEKSLDTTYSPKVSNFYGFRQIDYALTDGRKFTVVVPHRVAAGRPIAWRVDQFGEAPQVDIGLLQRGYHIVCVDKTTEDEKTWDTAHDFFKKAGLTGKITLIAMGDAGLPAYIFANAHPDAVAAIYGDSAQFTRHQDLAPAALAKAGVAIILVVGEKDTVGTSETNPSVVDTANSLEKSYKAAGGTIEVIRKKDAGHTPYSLPNPEPILNFLYAPAAPAK